MQIGTYARTDEQIAYALKGKLDYIDLRMDYEHQINFREAKRILDDAGVPITVHLPSDPEWKPTDITQDIAPFLELGQDLEAEFLTFHSPLSTLLYSDDEIDLFLESFSLVYDASKEMGVKLAIETLIHYYTELILFFDQFSEVKMVLDIGHGQILSSQNRVMSHIDSFFDKIEMINVHDNSACDSYKDDIAKRVLSEISHIELREMARKCDEHLPIGEGTIDFEPIFRSLKQRGYDGRFLMLSRDPLAFQSERKKFLKLWLSA
ncbi:MAG: sugar phosphate isomerase/epimerase [Candidatus Thorarchaeota archaeon]|nr:sugar phosphate isomerase/epimerase [Candidatus Thorarchaeota archaeon]